MIEPDPVVSDSVADKKKAASKREKNDAGISSSEREQARRDNGKPAKKTAGNTAGEAGATVRGEAPATAKATVRARRKKKLEKWPFEWLPFGMQE